LALILLLEMGVSSEMDMNHARNPRERKEPGTIVVDGSQVLAMRRLMHELANVLTGVMISGGLLAQYLHPGRPKSAPPGEAEARALWQYAAGVCEGCERGCGLLCELRGLFLAACGEADAGAFPSVEKGQGTNLGPLE